MKKRSAIIIVIILAVLASIMVYIFFIRGNEGVIETEESVEVPESTASLEPTPETTPEPTPKPTSTPESTPESTATPEPTEPPITKNEDGTYTFSDEFLESLSTNYKFFEGASKELMISYLSTMADSIESIKASDIRTAIELIGWKDKLVDIWSLPEEAEAAAAKSQTTSSPENNSSTSTNNNTAAQPPQDSQEQSGSSADWNLGDAFSDANTTPIGGDGTNIDHTGATVTVPGDASNSDEEGYINNGDGTITSSDGTFTMGDGSSFGGGGQNIDHTGAVIY